MSKPHVRFKFLLMLSLLLLVATGCGTRQYRYGVRANSQLVPLNSVAANGNPVSFGGTHRTIDKIERIVQIPRQAYRKLLNRPNVTPAELESRLHQSAGLAQNYLSANGLGGINIDVRRYEPGIQWQRLKANDNISPIWKYTGGTISHLRYTLVPKRALRWNSYNVFTNTIHLNSATSVDSVYYAAEAKQHHQQRLPGVYAMAQYIPIVPLLHSSVVANDAIGYSKSTQDWELERELTPASYSKVARVAVIQAISLGAFSNTVFPEVALLRWAGSEAGYAAGKAVAREREKSVLRSR